MGEGRERNVLLTPSVGEQRGGSRRTNSNHEAFCQNTLCARNKPRRSVETKRTYFIRSNCNLTHKAQVILHHHTSRAWCNGHSRDLVLGSPIPGKQHRESITFPFYIWLDRQVGQPNLELPSMFLRRSLTGIGDPRK